MGQTAEIILWGTGPGATTLKVETGEATIHHYDYSPDVQRHQALWLGEWERLFRITPRAPGDMRLNARTYDGQEYAAPIRLVAIDARAQAKNPTAVVLCDNATYYMAIRSPFTTVKVDAAGLGRYLRQCRDSGARLNYLVLYTHG